jgi:anti-anti-sigma factor
VWDVAVTVEVELARIASGARLRLRGILTRHDLPEVTRVFRQAEKDRPGTIELDLAELEYMDTSSLGMMAAQYKHCLEAGIEFRILNPPPSLMEILELTQLDRVLPLVTEKAEPAEAVPAEAPPAITGEQVLIIDDEQMVLQFCSACLKELGYRPLTAGDPAEAIRIFEREKDRIDLVILDLSMPDMSGEEVLARLKAIDPSVRVVVSSGLGEEAVQRLRGESAVRGLLEKPYRTEQLAAAVRQGLGEDSS